MQKTIIRDTLNFLTLKKQQNNTDRFFKNVLSKNSIPDKAVDGEKEWLEKWEVFGQKVYPTQYRVYSCYVGNDPRIVPEDLCHLFIEPVLNPTLYRHYYANKNCFDRVLPEGFCPATILRRIDGFFYDKDYKRLNTLNDEALNDILCNNNLHKKIILKLASDSNSGRGVEMYYKTSHNTWAHDDKTITLDYLNSFGKDLIIQEAVEQHEYLNQFNPSSINTLRLTTYRSVKDDTIHVLGAVVRIGAKGKVIDNAHAGGSFVGVNLDGTFCHNVVNQYGQKQTIFNGVNFERGYYYPSWNQVIEFAKQIANAVTHHRLLALDIALDSTGTPKLIEYNLMTFSPWFYQFTTGPAFGEFTDEIIEYCLAKKHTIKRYHTF